MVIVVVPVYRASRNRQRVHVVIIVVIARRLNNIHDEFAIQIHGIGVNDQGHDYVIVELLAVQGASHRNSRSSPASSLISAGLTSSEIKPLVVSSSVIRIPVSYETPPTVAVTVKARESFSVSVVGDGDGHRRRPFGFALRMVSGCTDSHRNAYRDPQHPHHRNPHLAAHRRVGSTPFSKLNCTVSSVAKAFCKDNFQRDLLRHRVLADRERRRCQPCNRLALGSPVISIERTINHLSYGHRSL